MQDRKAIDHGDEGVNHVLDPDNRYAALPHLPDQRHKARAFMLGEAARHLVEQQDARFRRQRPRQLQSLAIDERERAVDPVRLARETAAIENIEAGRVYVALAQALSE